MSTVVHCPSCRHPLSLRPELLGRAVRCPVCQTAFEAAAPAASLPPAPALSLDEGGAAEPPAPRRNLWGAVEIESPAGAPPPLPPAPDPAAPARPRPRPAADERTRCQD